MTKLSSRMYRISFYSQGNIYELYGKHIDQSPLFGFIELSNLVFGATSGLVVDPSEEKLKAEFGGVKSTYIPMHAILRIDEVEKEGIAKIREISIKASSNIAYFPAPVYTPTPPLSD